MIGCVYLKAKIATGESRGLREVPGELCSAAGVVARAGKLELEERSAIANKAAARRCS